MKRLTTPRHRTLNTTLAPLKRSTSRSSDHPSPRSEATEGLAKCRAPAVRPPDPARVAHPWHIPSHSIFHSIFRSIFGIVSVPFSIPIQYSIFRPIPFQVTPHYHSKSPDSVSFSIPFSVPHPHPIPSHPEGLTPRRSENTRGGHHKHRRRRRGREGIRRSEAWGRGMG